MRFRPIIIALFLMSASSLTALAVDLLYVSIYYDSAIRIYDTLGNSSNTFTNNLNAPLGLAFDSSANLYVANWGGGDNISKFNSSGDFQSKLEIANAKLHEQHLDAVGSK